MLTLICGLPNAGKTTYSSQFNNVVHIDDVIAKRHSPTETILEMIQESDNICVEGVFPLANSRKKFREAYRGNHTECIWINTPYEECVRRENRGRATIIIKNCNELFEPPSYSEEWDEIWVIENNEKHLMKREGE